jgi:protein TonB
MTAVSLLRDLAAFSVQIAIVVVVVAGLLRVVRIPARARYLCLRLTLLACLVVPWTLRSVVVVTETPVDTTARGIPARSERAASAALAPAPMSSTVAAQPRDLPELPWTTIGLVGLLVGVTARAIWLAIGFLRLGQLTRRAVPIESPEYAAVQEQLGTTATISEVDRLAQPVTFGFRRPLVLLPDSLAAAPSALRRAVVTHELFHVRRGDWLSLLGEEAVRTALWFHPAIHWLTSSIQLAREEMVDELTVRATGDRRAYMQALLAFADTGGLRVAPAFAHRRQLFHRIVSVSKEKVMSAPRIVMSVATLAVVVSSASWYASSAFPILTASRIELPAVGVPPIDDGWLIAEPQFITVAAALQRGSASSGQDVPNEVTPENPIPRRTRSVPPVMPKGAGNAQAVVSARVTLDRNGRVTSVERDQCHGAVDSCGAFFDSTADAIRQWRYDRPVRGPIQFYVTVTYRPGSEPAVAQSTESWSAYVRETQESLRLLAQETGGIAVVKQEDLERQLRSIAEQAASAETTRQRLTVLSNELRELERALRLAAERGPETGDLTRYRERLAVMNDQLAFLQQALARTRERSEVAESAARLAEAGQALRAVRAAEEAARDAEAERAVRDARVRALAERGLIAPSEAQRLLSQPVNERELVSPSGRTPIRISDASGVKPPVPTKRVNPEHPLPAMQARVAGTVILEVLVDEQGRVADARVTRSIPLLDQAALDAARQWEFTRTVVNGEPVPVLLVLEMNFTLK